MGLLPRYGPAWYPPVGYAIHIRPDCGLAIVTLAGRLDGAELLRAMRALAFDPYWVPGGRVLWDARYLRDVTVGPRDMPAFGAVSMELAHRMGPGRSAVLCRDAREGAAVRVLGLYRMGHPARELKAFLTWPAVADWLGASINDLLAPERFCDERLAWRPQPWAAQPPEAAVAHVVPSGSLVGPRPAGEHGPLYC